VDHFDFAKLAARDRAHVARELIRMHTTKEAGFRIIESVTAVNEDEEGRSFLDVTWHTDKGIVCVERALRCCCCCYYYWYYYWAALLLRPPRLHS
jgi:hypothetical protein